MATKELPTNIKTYYGLLKERASKQLEVHLKMKDELELELVKQHDELKSNLDLYKSKFNIDLLKYKEFIENKYLTGEFYKIAKLTMTNSKNDYELVPELYDVYNYAETLKDLNEINKDIKKYKTLSTITLKQYTEILRAYYTEVHKKMVLEGCGYAFSNYIGWMCVNRVISNFKGARKTLDYAATKKREAELKAQGKRIYNKEEADWCARHGIEYIAEDKRVYRNSEYNYEIPLMGSKLKNGTKLKLEISDYRSSSVRGKTNDDLIKLCEGDTKKICELPIDLKTKVTLCDKVDKSLYTKFIRNEAQKSVAASKAHSKD